MIRPVFEPRRWFRKRWRRPARRRGALRDPRPRHHDAVNLHGFRSIVAIRVALHLVRRGGNTRTCARRSIVRRVAPGHAGPRGRARQGPTARRRRRDVSTVPYCSHTHGICIHRRGKRERQTERYIWLSVSLLITCLAAKIRCILFESRTLSANRSRGVNNGQKHAGAGGSGARQLHRVHGVGAHRYRGWRRVWGPDRQSELRRVHECTQGGFVQAVLLRVVQ